MPNEKLVAGWAAQTPSPYKLTLKAPRRITHDSRLQNCGELVPGFCEVAATLGDKLGALLFQLPPNLKKDLALFDAFLDELPPRVCAAFEFRHASWFDDEVFARLARAIWRCASPTARSCRRRSGSPPTTPTSGCATRATRPTTSRAGRTSIARETAACRDVFVYFKHEEEGKGPEFARAADGAPRSQ